MNYSSSIAVTIDSPAFPEPIRKASVQSFQNCSDLQLEVLKGRYGVTADNGCVLGSKLRIFELFPEAERILYFDPNVIFTSSVDLAFMMDTDRLIVSKECETRPWVVADSRRIGVDRSEYFNVGIVCGSRERHAGMFKLAKALVAAIKGPLGEQTYLNWACALTATDTLLLDSNYGDRLSIFDLAGKVFAQQVLVD